jgi:hypothetical protein
MVGNRFLIGFDEIDRVTCENPKRDEFKWANKSAFDYLLLGDPVIGKRISYQDDVSSIDIVFVVNVWIS